MKRTRKWAYVAQEARRLAELGLTPPEIAAKLDIERQTVTRWMSAGKLTDTRKGSRRLAVEPEPAALQSPAQWAAAVRAQYALDATDEQLVALAQTALEAGRNPHEPASVRLQAMGRYQALVKQLALVAKAAEASTPAPAETKKPKPRIVHRGGPDPRRALELVS